jgi:hypothetical protein
MLTSSFQRLHHGLCGGKRSREKHDDQADPRLIRRDGGDIRVLGQDNRLPELKEGSAWYWMEKLFS